MALARGSAPPQDFSLTFNLAAPSLADGTDVFVTGSISRLGPWDPGRVKMISLGNHRWQKRIPCPNLTSVEYKYTLGTWEREGAQSNGAPLPNSAIQVKADTETHDSILFWTKPGPKHAVKSTITGHVDYYRSMKANGLRNRDVEVWLPPDYRTHPSRRYPVLYMQDGQNVFDAATSSFGNEWQADETADRLIRNHAIPPLIIVGIDNTLDRTPEYSPGKLGTLYMKFVVNRLKPFIDRTYRTKQDTRNSYVGGSSMGGLIAFMLVWDNSKTFSAAICMSPAFLDPDRHDWDFVKKVDASKKRNGVFFYIDDGGVGLDQTLQPGIDEMLAALKRKGYREGKDFVFFKDPSANHSETSWAKRLPNALKLILSSKR
jgi:predicted alpha/beta superfamily hydrolase